MLHSSEDGDKDDSQDHERFIEEITNAFRERFLKEFIDVLFLFKIEDKGEASGFDFLNYLHKTWGLMESPGTVYSVVYSMQRNNLIKGKTEGRKTVFSLTSEGKSVIETIRSSKTLLQFGFGDLTRINDRNSKAFLDEASLTPVTLSNTKN